MKKALFLSLILATSASASVDHYTVKGVFWSSAVPTAIAVGDHYTATFDLNLAVTDVDPALATGDFPNAVSNLTFSLDPGSLGNYAGGTMSAPLPLLLTDNNSGYDTVNFYMVTSAPTPGVDFAPADGSPFAGLNCLLTTNITDSVQLTSPLGQTLGSALLPLDQGSFPGGENFHLEFGDWLYHPLWAFSSITSVTVAPAPESSSWMTTAVAGAFVALMLGCARRRRRREVRAR